MSEEAGKDQISDLDYLTFCADSANPTLLIHGSTSDLIRRLEGGSWQGRFIRDAETGRSAPGLVFPGGGEGPAVVMLIYSTASLFDRELVEQARALLQAEPPVPTDQGSKSVDAEQIERLTAAWRRVIDACPLKPIFDTADKYEDIAVVAARIRIVVGKLCAEAVAAAYKFSFEDSTPQQKIGSSVRNDGQN